MKASQDRQKSYHDKRRKALEFQEGDHVFLRVTPMTGVGRALKSKKLTPKFIGSYQISKRVGTVAYRIGLPPHLSHASFACILSFNARKMVPHAYCICCCHRCIVGVVVGESLLLLWLLLLVELKVMLMLLIYCKWCILNYFVDI